MRNEQFKRGYFISVEGIDGSGKSVQIQKIKKYFEDLGFSVLVTREPGGIELAEKIREIIFEDGIDGVSETLLFAAARRIHLKKKVLPALNQGMIVISDRFVDSSITYQGCGRHVGTLNVKQINDFATNNIMPNLTILLDLDVETSLKRIFADKTREVNRLDKEKADFYETIRNGYLYLMKEDPERIKKVNANQSVEDVFLEIKRILDSIDFLDLNE